jgi:hypothetical protein
MKKNQAGLNCQMCHYKHYIITGPKWNLGKTCLHTYLLRGEHLRTRLAKRVQTFSMKQSKNPINDFSELQIGPPKKSTLG